MAPGHGGARMRTLILVLGLSLVPAAASAASYDVVDKDIATLQADMAAGRIDAVGLVEAYRARIAAIEKLETRWGLR